MSTDIFLHPLLDYYDYVSHSPTISAETKPN